MKKWIALLLGMMLLFSAAACAEGELPYLETEDLDSYINTTLLSEQSYPQVCISPFYAHSLFGGDSDKSWYVSFPAPEGARCAEFDIVSCHYIDLENSRQISYQATDSYSYETFLNKCEDESNIILDGSDKVAAYINPERGHAYALLGLDEIKRGAKLHVSIYLEKYRKMDEAELVQSLKDVITAEADRIKENMVCAQQDKFWSDGSFSGLKLISTSLPRVTVTQDLAAIDFHFDGNTLGGIPFVTKVHAEDYALALIGSEGKLLEIEGEVNTFSYVFYNREESEYTLFTAEDGSEWGLYVSNERDGKPYAVYASTVLTEKDKYGNDNPCYFTFQVSASRLFWADVDAVIEDMKSLIKTLSFEGLSKVSE